MSTLDFYVIALDETRNWNLEGLDPAVLKVEAVYLFDRNQHTHLCEITPSYTLYHVEDRAAYADNTPNEVIDLVDGLIMAESSEPVTYYHASDIDKLIGKVPTYHCGSPYGMLQFEGVDYDEALEGVLEYARCNSMV